MIPYNDTRFIEKLLLVANDRYLPKDFEDSAFATKIMQKKKDP